ncbi:MAG TPA: MFS transporter [Candidatus Binatia bacterium]|nr:MFS transporter [Candidatus Binatia bacterium]
MRPVGPAPPRPSPRLWVSTTYFAEGLPYMLVRFLSAVYLTDIGVKEAFLGFLNFLGLPWNFKFLWAPAVDLFGTKRSWLLNVEALIAIGAGLLALLAAFGPPTESVVAVASAAGAGSESVRWMLALLVALAFIAATHDVAIDAYYMEAIPDPTEQAAYTGLRVLTYRLAVVFAKSGLVGLAAWAGWTAGFGGGAACMAALLAFHAWYLPRFETARARGSMAEVLRKFGQAFSSYVSRPQIGLVLAFVVTYKLGDEVLFAMNTPFLMREVGVSKSDLSWMAGIVGTVASIAGSLVSAWAIERWGLRRTVWPLTLAMNLNIWAYVWLAWALPDAATRAGLATVAGVHAYEQFAAGLGNAVLVVFIMRTCLPEWKAAHYAIASAIASLGGTLFGGVSGVLVEQIGYLWLYVAAFLCALPSMAVLLVLRIPDEPDSLAAVRS